MFWDDTRVVEHHLVIRQTDMVVAIALILVWLFPTTVLRGGPWSLVLLFGSLDAIPLESTLRHSGVA